MDFATRKKYYNLCLPYESLEPGDERNIDLDNLGEEDKRVRGVNWAQRLARRIELSNRPVCTLFTGLPGSGKSTELKRLTARLSRRDGANLLVVLINAEDVIDLANPVEIAEIITAIVSATDEEVLKAEGKDPAQAMKDGYLDRLWNWLTETDVRFRDPEFAIPGGGKLVMEMKTRPTLREKVRQAISAHFSRFLEEARQELVLLNNRARRCEWDGLVIIFDSLEKLRGTSTNWDKVLDSAEKIFSSGATYLRLPVHVLYTVPPALASRSVGVDEFLPMIKLSSRDKFPFHEGLNAARELVRRRVPDDVLSELLGPESGERIMKLIEWSGGYPREIVRLLQAVIASEKHPLSETEFNRIRNEVSDTYRKVVPAEAFQWLARVAVDKYLTIADEKHRPVADLMLQNNVVLRYLNDQEWFDLHPSVYTIPGIREAIREQEEGQSSERSGCDEEPST